MNVNLKTKKIPVDLANIIVAEIINDKESMQRVLL